MGLFLIFALTFMLSAQQNTIGEAAPDLVIKTSDSNTDIDVSGNPMAVPFMGNISGGLKPKMTFIIHGFVPEKADRFSINFVAGLDVPLHLNPRLPERTVVRNSLLKGRWGQEEIHLPFNPFQKGKFFKLSITCGQYQFIVYANDEFLFSYTHRYADFPYINILNIKGDVILYHIHY